MKECAGLPFPPSQSGVSQLREGKGCPGMAVGMLQPETDSQIKTSNHIQLVFKLSCIFLRSLKKSHFIVVSTCYNKSLGEKL